ncbi:hypothetical protein JCM10207_006917 [Rhodosporidiobolus poonsookiae]
MLSSIFSSPSVKVALEEDQLFVHPLPGDFPTSDPILRGTALVTLPSRRAIKKFKVIFEGLVDAYGGDGYQYETSTALKKELETDFKGEVFEAGNHAFNFSFIVPSSTAVSQRSAYGRTRYYVKAYVEFDGGLLSTSVSSSPTAVWISANPSPPGELPYPTDLAVQHFSEDLGPVGIHVSSPHLTVAALANVRVSLLGPPQPVKIISVNGVITQTFEVTYKNGKVAKPKPRPFVLTKVDHTASPSLFVPVHNPATCTVEPGPVPTDPSTALSVSPVSAPYLEPAPTPEPAFRPVSACCHPKPDQPVPDPSPLARVEPGQEFHHARIVRVPDDDHVRPTTLEGTDTPIRVSHKMSVEIRYRKEGDTPDTEDMVLTIGKPITITSCCCLIDSIYLPTYTAAAPKTVTRPLMSRCACNMSLKECFDRDGALLQRATSLPSPSSEPRLIGIDKSPAWTDGSSSGYSTPIPSYLRQDSEVDSGFGSSAPSMRDTDEESCQDSPVVGDEAGDGGGGLEPGG